MMMTRSEYDREVSSYSPEGRLLQVEYALEAIKLGTTAIGISTAEGIILAVEKHVTSPLIEPESIEKIMEIDSHIGCAMSGLTADAKTIVEHARKVSQMHRFRFNEPIMVNTLTQSICDLALRFGEGAHGEERKMARPFGVALLIAGIDENGPQLYHAEPSGTFFRFDAKAIGSGSEGAQAELASEYHKSMTLAEAELTVLRILKSVMEETLDAKNIQLSSVTKENGYHIYSLEETIPIVNKLSATITESNL